MNTLRPGLLVVLLLTGVLQSMAFDSAGAQSNCTDDELIPLYPGYPGFRGYLPDTVGQLEWLCPDELDRLNPRFYRRTEDRRSRGAAEALGIAGVKEDWTWENWMAIEAERGLPSTCFACAIFNPPAFSLREPPGRVDRSSDPRYLISSLAEKNIALRWADSIGGNTASILNSAPTDLQIKALSGLTAAGDYLTAQEVVNLSEELLALLFGIEEGPVFRFDTGKACRNLFDQHGYAPTPEDASVDDQIFTMVAGFHGISFLLPTNTANIHQSMLSRLIQDWQMEVMSEVRTPSLGEWLQDWRDEFGC